jgi:anti-anti-sigma factor
MSASPSPGHAEHIRELLARHRRPSAPIGLPCSITLEGDRATIAPVGRLDGDTVAILDAVMADMHGRGFGRIVVDLRGLSSIDSAGIGLLLRWAAASARSGRELLLHPGSDRAELVVALSGVLRRRGVDAAHGPEPPADGTPRRETPPAADARASSWS